jgi:hypothetical protein
VAGRGPEVRARAVRGGPAAGRLRCSRDVSGVEGADTAATARVRRRSSGLGALPAPLRRIVQARADGPIETTSQLVRAVGSTQLRGRSSSREGKGIHPATRTFQVGRAARDALACRRPAGQELQRLRSSLRAAHARLCVCVSLSCSAGGLPLGPALPLQALRIAVNDELGRLRQVRLQAGRGGRGTAQRTRAWDRLRCLRLARHPCAHVGAPGAP